MAFEASFGGTINSDHSYMHLDTGDCASRSWPCKIRVVASMFLAVCVIGAAFAETPANNITSADQDAILDTIAQINHINWVWNTIKTYNNSIVLAEEYDKISPGNLNLNRIPDDDTRELIRGMLDTLHSLSMSERELRHWRQNFNESRHIKLKTYDLNASKKTFEMIAAQASEFSKGAGYAAVVQTIWNLAHYCASLQNDYENFVYELDKEIAEKNFSFDTEKMEILHKQNMDLLKGQWQLIRRYRFDDRLRISDNDIQDLLSVLKDDTPSRVYTRLALMRERFSLFPEYWYYLSCVAMGTGHFKEGLEACDTFFSVNRGIFRTDQMKGTVAFNKAFMLPKTDANKPIIRECLELVRTNNVIRSDWQLSYLGAIMYSGVFNERSTAETMLEEAIANIESSINERRRYRRFKAGVTLELALRNCRNALHQLRGEPLEEKNEMEASLVETQNVVRDGRFSPISATNMLVSISLPNDRNIHDWSKYTLQLLSRGNVVANVNATATDCVLNTNGYIELSFNTTFVPSSSKIDEYSLTYNNSMCPLKWTFRTILYYCSNAEMDSFYEEILELMRSKSMWMRFGVWLMSDEELTTVKNSFIEALCLEAHPYSVSINGREFFYVHALHSLYQADSKDAETKNKKIFVEHIKRLCMDLEGAQYADLDEFLPYVKGMSKDVWRDMVKELH